MRTSKTSAVQARIGGKSVLLLSITGLYFILFSMGCHSMSGRCHTPPSTDKEKQATQHTPIYRYETHIFEVSEGATRSGMESTINQELRECGDVVSVSITLNRDNHFTVLVTSRIPAKP